MQTSLYEGWRPFKVISSHSSTKTCESVNFFPFARSHPLFSKVFYGDSPFSEEYRHCSLYCSFTVRWLTFRLED